MSDSELPWVDAAQHPLGYVEGHEYTLSAGYEDLRVFAIRLRRGDYEYHLGAIDDGGSIIGRDGDDTGRQVGDVAFYFKIHEPATKRSEKEANDE